jgi:PAS domain S-box-containing protein
MKIYELAPGMYDYTHLPAFAGFILKDHLDEFVRDQIRISQEVNIPLLKHLAQFREEELYKISKQAASEYLEYLSRNQAKEQLLNSFSRWVGDQLQVIGKFDISAEDITVFNYMRGKLLKKWVQVYDIPLKEKYELIDEIDNLLFGNTTSAMNTFISILKQKISEESHLNAQLTGTSPGIIFIFDVIRQKEVYINGNVEGVMGYTRQEILDMESNLLSMLTHPEDVELLSRGIQAILKSPDGRSHQMEYRFKHKNGTYKWLRTYTTIFKRDENGNPVEVLGTSFEITREKETALALARHEAQLLEAQSIAKIGSFEWDIIKDQSVNTPQLLEIFEAEQQHLDFMSHVHPEDKEKVERAMAQSFVTGEYDCQYRYRARNKEKVLWARGVVVFRESKPVLMRGTVQDITELKKIEEALKIKTQELERSNESLQQFASIASHDLKEPLRKMSMYSDMVLTLEEGKISESSLTSLEKVKASSIRMQQMIEDILNFSSITNEAKKERVNLTKILNEALEILDDAIREKGATVTADDLPDVAVIPAQIRQLFQNLISNSLKFSRKDVKPKITITHNFKDGSEFKNENLKPGLRYLHLMMSDNGIGFKQEHAQKIFGLFTRLHARSSYEGSGLGLSICKRIVENHEGTITAASDPGAGATFAITIPCG